MTDKRLSDRRRYRRIFTRLWRNQAYRAMSDGERNMALYLLSGPQTNRIGLFLFSPATAAEELDRPLRTIKARVRKVCQAFTWEWDEQNRVVWIPTWWTFNNPKDNAKAFQGALTDLNEVPQTPLLQRFCRNLVGIPEALHTLMAPLWEAIPDRIGDPIHDPIHDPIGVGTSGNREQGTGNREQGNAPHPLFALWNATVETLPKAEVLSPDRKAHAAHRLREQPDLAAWAGMFRRMDGSDFLTGRKPSVDHPNWRADFDFAMKPGTFGKVLEGKYDNRAGPTRVPDEWTCQHVERCSNRAMCDNATILKRPVHGEQQRTA
jgi:hypothetical protein